MEETVELANILVVDDRPDKLLALKSMLEDLNQNLITANSGDEALRRLLKEDFAVILLDVNMPGMDGFETAAMVRQRKRSETTPIIFISAVNDAENHVSRGYSLGAVDYILTPVVPEILRAKVAVFVDLFNKTEQIKRQAQEHAELIREQAARAEAEAAKQRLAFLAEASKVLAGSLDYQQTFDNLAQLVVPRLADFCIIDRLDEDGQLRQVAVAHIDASAEPLLRAIRYPRPDETGHGALRVFQRGRSELRTNLTEAQIDRYFPGADGESIKKLAPRSYIAVPLIARGKIVGAITMANTRAGRSCGESELSLAEELASRAALALDNAALYRAANQARLEAERANRAKDRFLAMLSHELRTPLTPVITSLINLERDGSVPEPMRAPLGVIRRNVELEARLIDDLLDLTRVGTGKIHLNQEVVDAKSLLENAIEICLPEIEAKNLALSVDMGADAAYVTGDPARLQQIFWNLLKNAVKFTPSGKISVTLTLLDDHSLRISISDTGLGIDEALLPRIFKPFEQGESGKHGGLGLGLSITKALVDLHQGRIGAISPGTGNGATFTVELPLTNPPATAPAERPPEPSAERQPMRILLLEDHVDSNDSLTLLLTMRGYEVTSAYDVKSAMKLAEENHYDVLISDLGLPDGTAGDVMEVLSERSTAVGIAISGYGMEDDIRRSRGYGFSHHLIKPVEVSRLESVLEQLPRSESRIAHA
jgi:signal transduction histidine kinase/DNA-binding response OmpR family regulator